ncbi:hypothetical protein ACPXAT_27265, partial [Klebsiella pneumoniae]|uniref:hypothetical protein n=1 Tax=Klebsiella pneumoniae TaxID=573 RepID=UPI003CFA0B26
ILDVPVARTDVTFSMGGDGSFRARLANFRASEDDQTPAAHVQVVLSGPGMIPLQKELYLRSGVVSDLGTMKATRRDPAV